MTFFRRDHLDELTKVESGIEEARAKLSTLQAEQELVQRQLEHLEALIAAKKKDRNISELVYAMNFFIISTHIIGSYNRKKNC